MYRLGAGITNINNKSQYERTNEWSFTPNLILGYQLSKNQSLQLISSYKPNTPSGEQLSSNIVQLVPNIVKQGNPYLKPEYLWKNQLKYSFNNKYLTLISSLSITTPKAQSRSITHLTTLPTDMF